MMRKVILTCGLLVLAAAWLSPLRGIANHAFYGHMTVHMAVVAIAAPLLALAISGTRWDPVCRVPALFPALPASLLELAVVWLWHTPVLHQAARQHPAIFAAEQATFLLSGLALWIAVFGGNRATRADRSATGVVALLLTAMHMTLLGALLALSPRALYTHTHSSTGMSPLDDQHLGGAIMLIIGGLSYVAGGLYLSADLLRTRDTPPASPGIVVR
jgi:putative membrane protein